MALCIVGICMLSASCNDDDNDGSGNGSALQSATGPYFIAVKASSGTEYIMQAESLEEGDLNISDNIMELPQTEYTWIFKDDVAIGMVYQQQFAGMGYGFRYKSDATLEKLGEFRISTRFSNYGFFDGQLLTSVAGQVSSDGTRNDGATFAFWDINDNSVSLDRTQTLWTEDITGNGQQVTFSGVVDMGGGEFLSSMVQSAFNQTGTGNGSSVGDVAYPDSVWVARIDRELNIKHIYRDDRISYSAGQYRSQVLSQMGKADNGTVYVFSGAFDSQTTRPCGALRILPDATAFDPDYYFNIEHETGGYKIRRLWHITGSKFCLEIYNDLAITTITPGHQFAIVDMESQSFQWITGIPSKSQILSGAETGGVPLFADGKLYLPITVFGEDASIYIVNPTTAEATKGITLKGVYEIRTLGKLSAG